MSTQEQDLILEAAEELLARRKARKSILDFVLYFRPEYVPWSHHIMLCNALDKIMSGEIKRLLVNMPPGHAKSEYVSRYFPPYFLGRNPSKYIIMATYAQDIADGFGRDVLNIVKQPEFTKIMPDLALRQDSKAASRFHTIQRGGYYSVGLGSGLTSRRGHGAIIDDPFKDHKEARNKRVREEAIAWYKNVLLTRLFSEAFIILTQTRWHEGDLTGWILKEGKEENWVHLNLPAIAVDKDPLGRQIGEALWPAQFPIKYLLHLRNDPTGLGPRFFEALYQQNPSIDEGNIFLRKNWRFWNKNNAPAKFNEILLSIDTNVEEGADNDFTSIGAIGMHGIDRYVLDRVKGVWGMSDQMKNIRMMAKKWPTAWKKLLEKKANGPAIQNLMKNELTGIVMVEPQGNKTERALAVEPMHVSGHCFLPEDRAAHPWVEEFIEELAGFPNAEHDDDVDMFTQALNYWNNPGSSYLAKIAQK